MHNNCLHFFARRKQLICILDENPLLVILVALRGTDCSLFNVTQPLNLTTLGDLQRFQIPVDFRVHGVAPWHGKYSTQLYIRCCWRRRIDVALSLIWHNIICSGPNAEITSNWIRTAENTASGTIMATWLRCPWLFQTEFSAVRFFSLCCCWWCSQSTHISAQTTWPILYSPTATMIQHAIGSARRPAPTTVLCSPYGTRTKFGDRAFSVARPVVWNSLPAAVRHADSLHSFKRRLKSHFFSSCFNDWQCNALQVRFRSWRTSNSPLLTYLLTYCVVTGRYILQQKCLKR